MNSKHFFWLFAVVVVGVYLANQIDIWITNNQGS